MIFTYVTLCVAAFVVIYNIAATDYSATKENKKDEGDE